MTIIEIITDPIFLFMLVWLLAQIAYLGGFK